MEPSQLLPSVQLGMTAILIIFYWHRSNIQNTKIQSLEKLGEGQRNMLTDQQSFITNLKNAYNLDDLKEWSKLNLDKEILKLELQHEKALASVKAERVEVVPSGMMKGRPINVIVGPPGNVTVPAGKSRMEALTESVEKIGNLVPVLKERTDMWQEYRAVVARQYYKKYPEYSHKDERDKEITKTYPKNAPDIIQIIDEWISKKGHEYV